MYFDWKNKINEKELNEVGKKLRNGEIVIFPTETVYGIGANALDENAVKKIFEAKGRPSDNPLIVHLASVKDVEKIAQNISKTEKKLIENFMPGPFTLILQRKNIIPNIVTAGLETVAIRIPDNKIANEIIKNANVPIAAPSANISGKPSGTNINDIRNELESRVSAIVDGGDTLIGLESTVVKVIDDIPVILRPGKITPEQIKEKIGEVELDKNIFCQVSKDTKVESPGMKYRHYAPETKCMLINCEKEIDQIESLNNFIKEYQNVVVIGFKEHKEKLDLGKNNFIEVGKINDLESFAQNIYSSLRYADKLKAKIILIEGVKKEGLGYAIMNRLIRTCANNVFEK